MAEDNTNYTQLAYKYYVDSLADDTANDTFRQQYLERARQQMMQQQQEAMQKSMQQPYMQQFMNQQLVQTFNTESKQDAMSLMQQYLQQSMKPAKPCVHIDGEKLTKDDIQAFKLSVVSVMALIRILPEPVRNQFVIAFLAEYNRAQDAKEPIDEFMLKRLKELTPMVFELVLPEEGK